jgi:hypothetical protein
VELVSISLAAAFCGGLAWALDHELFAVVFAAAAVMRVCRLPDPTPTHGYEPTREAAMAAFAKSCGRE